MKQTRHALTDAAFDSGAADSATISMTIASAQLSKVLPMLELHLDIAQGAVSDLEGNAISASPDNAVLIIVSSEMPQSTAEQSDGSSSLDSAGADSKSASSKDDAQDAAPPADTSGNGVSAPETSGSQNADADSASEALPESSGRGQAETQAYAITNDKAPPDAVFKPSDGRLARDSAGKNAGAFLMP